MADPLLSTLCTICHINEPRYTCPRCSVQTCSLPCVSRHKLWSSCSGQRDPTVYKSRAELLTPSGIDHDYNFLHSIEHQIERSEQEIVEERGLVHRNELRDARKGVQDNGRSNPRTTRGKQAPGEECIKTMLKIMNTKVHRAPKGLQRNLENGTSWSKNTRQINWQVEWMRNNGTTRQLGKMLNNKSIAYHYDEWVEEDKRARMTEEERRVVKKRKATEVKERTAKRVKASSASSLELAGSECLQNPDSVAWNLSVQVNTQSDPTPSFSPDTYSRVNKHELYLLRPFTSSKLPKVVAPINVSKPLSEILRNREIIEFPTIYVFEEPLETLPADFMLEQDFLVATGQVSNISSGSESSKSSSEEDEEMTDVDSVPEDGEVDE